MVLNAGIQNVIDLTEGDPSGKKYTKIVVGTSNTPVTGNETALTGQVAKNITSVIDDGDGYITFNSQLDAADPAMTIQEMGLLNQDGVLCYRKVVTPQSKLAGVTYTIFYKLRVQ